MKKLFSLDTARLHHAELGQFIVRFYEDFGASTLDASTDADFKRMFDAIQAQLPNYNSALDQIRASEESAKSTKMYRTILTKKKLSVSTPCWKSFFLRNTALPFQLWGW